MGPADKTVERAARFVREYVKADNDQAAAYNACPWTRCKTYGSAHAAASRYMRRPEVRAELAKLEKVVESDLGLTPEYVLNKWKAVLETNVLTLFRETDGYLHFRSFDSIPEELQLLIQEVQTRTTRTRDKEGDEVCINQSITVKLIPKSQVLDSLAKHLKMYSEEAHERDFRNLADILEERFLYERRLRARTIEGESVQVEPARIQSG